ncbi:hypothetical protein [uncultured Cohaesibacter sp.]|uniref:pentapeptide repeat-containing protein n=1 Tax=uncultured Cohaesibacter sp. TaxID=1002546 RepID=UPI0029C6FCDB|nr:hypothetical protein [uncultured Cohaesibacter sp.]
MKLFFFGSKINNIRLDSVVLNGVHFNNSKLGKLYLSVLGNKSKYIKNLTFNSSDLSGATLHNWEAAFLKEVDFSESNISGLRMNIRACSLSDVNLIRKKLSKAWAWSDNLPRISIRCDSPYDADIAVNSYKICPNSIQTNYEKHQGFGIPKGC